MLDADLHRPELNQQAETAPYLKLMAIPSGHETDSVSSQAPSDTPLDRQPLSAYYTPFAVLRPALYSSAQTPTSFEMTHSSDRYIICKCPYPEIVVSPRAGYLTVVPAIRTCSLPL
jgi:hypothetical protein